jgi:iron complex outermembrane receptor protein
MNVHMINKSVNPRLVQAVSQVYGHGRIASVFSASILAAPMALAQQAEMKQLEEVVVSASRIEQRRFDAPAAIDAVQVDPFRAASPLVNLSELTAAVPGLQVRDRQNFAQDLQVSVRGFGTRSTFGVRGVRILVDGIPATMPDGQGQAATASLTSARQIEVLRGPLAQLYGNSAGGVVQIFTKDPPIAPQPGFVGLSAGAGSDNQRQLGASIGGGTETLGALADISRFSTDGYRDHSAARRTQFNGKLVARPSSDTTVTGIVNIFDQPESQDPLGLTRADFERNPRQVVPAAIQFDTRKTIDQKQAGIVVDHRLSASDTLNARIYGGQRQVFQTLAFSGATTAGGVVDLDRDYGGVGLSWTHKMQANGMPLNWTVGFEADKQDERRRGLVNNNGTPGALRRNEDDVARNTDVFGQVDWTFDPQWRLIAGMRASRVRLSVDDQFLADGKNDSGSVRFNNTSPVAGLVWHATDAVNVYANLGRGFETPTLAESAYRAGDATGPNLSLRPSKSTQAEIGMKMKTGRHALELAVFDARSSDEIVPSQVIGGRSVFQNVDKVERRGAEASWHASWGRFSTRLAYTWLDAQFRQGFSNAQGGRIAAGNRLPGAPEHSLFTEVEYKPTDTVTTGLEMRVESKAYVDDVNSDTAPGYAVLNLRTAYEFRVGAARMNLFGRIDNLLDKNYAGSVIVNDGNQRFFEPAPGRRLFVGLRTMF